MLIKIFSIIILIVLIALVTLATPILVYFVWNEALAGVFGLRPLSAIQSLLIGIGINYLAYLVRPKK